MARQGISKCSPLLNHTKLLSKKNPEPQLKYRTFYSPASYQGHKFKAEGVESTSFVVLGSRGYYPYHCRCWIQSIVVAGSNETSNLTSASGEGVEFLKAGRTESESGEREFYFLEVEGIDFLEREKDFKENEIAHDIVSR